MQHHEEHLIERMWIEFSRGKTVNNSVCSDFFFTMVRPDRNFSHLNAFEVLDTIVNCELPVGHDRPLVRKRKPLVGHELDVQSDRLPTLEGIEETTVEITIETPAIPDPVPDPV